MPASSDPLRILARPTIGQPRLVLAFSGWMDGGEVSTGSVNTLIDQFLAHEVAALDPEDFYILNFPGSMEISALFRPRVRVRKGRVRSFEMPTNTFYAAPAQRLILFSGKEPHIHWRRFADAVFGLCRTFKVRQIYFVGSFGGSVPHTRQPRLYTSFSHPRMGPALERAGLTPSDYRGPAGISSYLMHRAPAEKCRMTSLVAEIPGYLDGANPLCIEAVTRKLAGLLEIKLDFDALRSASDEWEVLVSQAVAKNAKLAHTVRQLEQQYDDELLQSPLGQQWMDNTGHGKA